MIAELRTRQFSEGQELCDVSGNPLVEELPFGHISVVRPISEVMLGLRSVFSTMGGHKIVKQRRCQSFGRHSCYQQSKKKQLHLETEAEVRF